LDIAVVLSSLYPAGTILMAYILLKTHIHRKQMIGVLMCIAATVLIMS
jgi:drug/metabolite transporter (DMT)-like permease